MISKHLISITAKINGNKEAVLQASCAMMPYDYRKLLSKGNRIFIPELEQCKGCVDVTLVTNETGGNSTRLRILLIGEQGRVDNEYVKWLKLILVDLITNLADFLEAYSKFDIAAYNIVHKEELFDFLKENFPNEEIRR